jgi:hypothetical protein
MVDGILSMELFYEIKFNLHKKCLEPKKLQKCIVSSKITDNRFNHGLRTPMKPFFIEIQNFWVWADKLVK